MKKRYVVATCIQYFQKVRGPVAFYAICPKGSELCTTSEAKDAIRKIKHISKKEMNEEFDVAYGLINKKRGQKKVTFSVCPKGVAYASLNGVVFVFRKKNRKLANGMTIKRVIESYTS